MRILPAMLWKKSAWMRMGGLIIVLGGAGLWLRLENQDAHSTEIQTGEETERASAVPIVELIHPKPGGLPRTIQQPATIQAFETVDLYAMVSGYLKSQSVDIGSRLKKGEILAEINVPRDAKAVEEANSLVEQARARIRQAEVLIQVAKAQHEAVAATVKQAAADVDRARAERVLAEKQLARVRGLAAERAADLRLVDEQEKAFDAAAAAERSATIAVQTAQARVLAAAAEVEKATVDAAAAGAALDVAEASRDRLVVNLKYAKIIAPFDGVVTRRAFHPGALIHSATTGGAQPLFTMKRTDLMRVVVLVPDRDVVWTKIGQPAVVNVDALGGRSFEGKVARVALSENSERMMRVEIDLPNPEFLLYDGMYGKATINLERNLDGLAVPRESVIERMGRSGGAVYVVSGETARRADVQLGGENGTLVEIVSGIGPGDAVVVRSSTPLEDGMRVATSR